MVRAGSLPRVSENAAPDSSSAAKTICWKSVESTSPEQEHVSRNPPGATSFIASRFKSL